MGRVCRKCAWNVFGMNDEMEMSSQWAFKSTQDRRYFQMVATITVSNFEFKGTCRRAYANVAFGNRFKNKYATIGLAVRVMHQTCLHIYTTSLYDQNRLTTSLFPNGYQYVSWRCDSRHSSCLQLNPNELRAPHSVRDATALSTICMA